MELKSRKLGELVRQVSEKNKTGEISVVLGVSIFKEFMPSVANLIGTDLKKYNVLRKNRFAFNPMHVGRDEKLPIALYKSDTPALVSPAYMMCEKKTNDVTNEYLELCFKTLNFDHLCWFHSDASVRGGLSWEDFANIEISVPTTIEEQNSIVNKHNAILNRIHALERQDSLLLSIVRSNFDKMLCGYDVESESLPEGWAIKEIGDFVDIKSGFAFKSDWWQKEGVPVVKISNIVEGGIDFTEASYVSAENAKRAKDFYVGTGDLLIAMTGATCGKLGIMPFSHEKAVVNQRVGKFFFESSDPVEQLPFIYCSLLTQSASNVISPQGDAGSAQDNISPDDIKGIKIVFPGHDFVKSFNDKYSVIFRTLAVHQAEIISLKKLNEMIIFEL